jgi:molecular chaperone DnaJ
MSKTDLYKTLGVSQNASAEDIKKAYRKLAMKHHPDKNPGDKNAEKKFREASEAYEILKDDQKRAAYDRYGSAAFEQGMGGPGAGPGGASGFGGFGFSANFSDIIDEMFGGMGGSGGRAEDFQQSGSDVRFNLEVSLEEAFKGTTARIKFPIGITCDKCNGLGSEGGLTPTNCSSCQGRGKTRYQQGFFTIEKSCNSCGGSGKTVTDPCRSCSGQGRVKREKNLEVKIPAGVEEGTRIRVSREGEAGLRGGPPGDLYVFISIRPHKLFKRQGGDLFCRIPIRMTTAALGGEIEVPCIDGSKGSLKIPAGTQSGQQFRLRGKGMSILRSSARGDLIIEAGVETPVNLTKKQKEILAQFEETTHQGQNSPESSGFFAKVKEFLG